MLLPQNQRRSNGGVLHCCKTISSTIRSKTPDILKRRNKINTFKHNLKERYSLACIVLSCHQQNGYIIVNFDDKDIFDILFLLFPFLIFNLVFNHFFVTFYISLTNTHLRTYSLTSLDAQYKYLDSLFFFYPKLEAIK